MKHEPRWKRLQDAVVNGYDFVELWGDTCVVKHSGRVVYAKAIKCIDNPYNVPDWRDQSTYSKLSSLTPSECRWEFLRRDASYRAFWDSTMELIADGWETEPELDYYVADYYINKLVDPRLLATEFSRRVLSGADYIVRDVSHHDEDPVNQINDDMADERHVLGMLQTAKEAAAYANLQRKSEFRTLDEFVQYGEHVNGMLTMIRTDRPLKPQFAAIERLVAVHRPLAPGVNPRTKAASAPRPRAEKFPLYLRLLDARDRTSPYHASWSEITRVLSKQVTNITMDVHTIRSSFDRAEKTRATLIEGKHPVSTAAGAIDPARDCVRRALVLR